MQLIIASNGLSEPVKDHIDNTIAYLRTAKATAVNPPYGFQYANYVRELDGLIQDYINETNYIENGLKRAERDYDELFQKSINKVKNMPDIQLEERAGLRI